MEELRWTHFLLVLIALSSIFSSASAYTLDGEWDLTPQHLNYTSSNPNTKLTFKNNIVTPAIQPVQDSLDGSSINVVHKGNNRLTVEACKTLTYNYYISENSIYLQMINSSG